MRKKFRVLAGSIVLVTALGMSGFTTASAAVQDEDDCYFRTSGTSVWGWCDGNGPERYRIWADCGNRIVVSSPNAPWYGDRRGATATCPTGKYVDSYWGSDA
ncbi:hypothetical protein ABZ208_30765 [Streptomyces sp. NPDC006208]|uniref:hypothetical protein n=1 Tax=Streptomyces sp. NPDC006208 TaxID=3156734 RepID=UPI0033BE1508